MKLPAHVQRFRRNLCDQYIGMARGVLHLGAHLGQEAEKYSAFGKPVLWVEALPDIHAELAEHIRKYRNQRSICALLGAADGEERTFFISNNVRGISSSLFTFGTFASGERSLWPGHDLHMVDSIVLRTTTLDTLFREHDIDPAGYDYWVMDLQGAEKLALSGAGHALRSCRALLVEVSTVEVYENGVLWPELLRWLQGAGFTPLWDPELPHDDVLFVRVAELDRVRKEFQSENYLDHNRQRLLHLASLQLDLSGKSVLEVGAGIGDHTVFYLERGCTITVTDVRPENLAILRDRFRETDAVRVQALDLSCPRDLGRQFDVIHCYGVLYHLENPALALEFLARHCAGLMLIETCVSVGDDPQINPLPEPAQLASQAFYGKGCRPTRSWIWAQLRKSMPFIYVPKTQPVHEEFPLDWKSEGERQRRYRRAIFVASRRSLDSNACLASTLLDTQVPCIGDTTDPARNARSGRLRIGDLLDRLRLRRTRR